MNSFGIKELSQRISLYFINLLYFLLPNRSCVSYARTQQTHQYIAKKTIIYSFYTLRLYMLGYTCCVVWDLSQFRTQTLTRIKTSLQPGTAHYGKQTLLSTTAILATIRQRRIHTNAKGTTHHMVAYRTYHQRLMFHRRKGSTLYSKEYRLSTKGR